MPEVEDELEEDLEIENAEVYFQQADEPSRVVSPGFIAAKRRDFEIEAAKKRGGLK